MPAKRRPHVRILDQVLRRRYRRLRIVDIGLRSLPVKLGEAPGSFLLQQPQVGLGAVQPVARCHDLLPAKPLPVAADGSRPASCGGRMELVARLGEAGLAGQ